jgi:hypothetical protein
MKYFAGLALTVLSLAVGFPQHGRAEKAPDGPLRVISGLMSGFALNGRRVAWEGAGQVVVADVDSGRRVAVAKGHGDSPVAMALSGSTVLWFDITGGTVRLDSLKTASPGGRGKILSNWFEDTQASVPVGRLFGGVTGEGGGSPSRSTDSRRLAAIRRRATNARADDASLAAGPSRLLPVRSPCGAFSRRPRLLRRASARSLRPSSAKEPFTRAKRR